MYLRISKGRQKSYLVLVEGYRENGKAKQRTICNLGAIDPNTTKKTLLLGRKLLNQFGASAIIDGSELAEESRQNWGAYEVLQVVWKRYSLDKFFDSKLANRKLQYDLQGAIQMMLAGRLCKPTSKLALYENQEFYAGFGKFALQDLYKSLDELDYYKDDLSAHLFKHQQLIFGKVQVAFFDVTSMYFESTKVDELRNFGFSKDCKFNEVQIILSLITDQNGNPLAYELFKGNMYEGHTLLSTLNNLKNKYNIDKIIIVADRGIYLRANLEAVANMGFEYIVGTKLKNNNKRIKKLVLDQDGYNDGIIFSDEDASGFKWKKIVNERGAEARLHKENIIIAWSKKRAKKDMQDRSRLIEKATKLATNSNINDKRGGRKYLKMGKTTAELDVEKISEDRRWDGYYGVSTNSDLSPQEVLSAYHNLWRIEESFRLMKNYFETRPMFHWTEKRISGHIMLNFIAMIFERYIENKINDGRDAHEKISSNDIRQELVSMQKSLLLIDHQRFCSYAKLSANSEVILKKLAIDIPKSTIVN